MSPKYKLQYDSKQSLWAIVDATAGATYKNVEQVQERVRSILQNEVRSHANELVELYMQANPEWIYDLDNISYEICTDCDEAIDECECDSLDSNRIESRNNEVYVWWIISEWLYNKLKELGYVVGETDHHYIYGQCHFGTSSMYTGEYQQVICLTENQIYEASL